MSATAQLRPANLTIGLDLGDKRSRVYSLPAQVEHGEEAMLPTTRGGLTRYFGGRPRCRVVLEVGTHSPWVARELASLGHEVLVANPSAMYGDRRRRKRFRQRGSARRG